MELLVMENLVSEIAECWLSRYEVSVRWGKVAKAYEAGRQYLKEVVKVGDHASEDVVRSVRRFDLRPDWKAFEVHEPEVR